jgi:hypothetical protein
MPIAQQLVELIGGVDSQGFAQCDIHCCYKLHSLEYPTLNKAVYQPKPNQASFRKSPGGLVNHQ